MRTVLVVASLWANADPAATKQPIGPWLAPHVQSLSKTASKLQLELDKLAASSQDGIFEIQVFSLADEAAGEIRFVADLPEKRSTSAVALKREKARAVQAILPHILAAGHARPEAQHMVSTAGNRPAAAVQYVKTPITIVDAGIARTSLTMRQQGDQFQLTTAKIAFATTEFSVSITPDPGAMPFVRAPQPATITSHRGRVSIGESLVLFREAITPVTQPAGAKVVQAAAVEPEKEPPRATLFIITPRRGPKLPPPPPELFKRL